MSFLSYDTSRPKSSWKSVVKPCTTQRTSRHVFPRRVTVGASSSMTWRGCSSPSRRTAPAPIRRPSASSPSRHASAAIASNHSGCAFASTSATCSAVRSTLTCSAMWTRCTSASTPMERGRATAAHHDDPGPRWKVLSAAFLRLGDSAWRVERFSYFPEQIGFRERLREQHHAFLERSLRAEDGLRVAGHEDDAHPGPQLSDLFCDLAPEHLWHDDVGEDEVDRAVVTRDGVDRLLPARRRDHRVAAAREQAARHLAQGLLVLDDEHRLAARRPAPIRGTTGGADVQIGRAHV